MAGFDPSLFVLLDGDPSALCEQMQDALFGARDIHDVSPEKPGLKRPPKIVPPSEAAAVRLISPCRSRRASGPQRDSDSRRKKHLSVDAPNVGVPWPDSKPPFAVETRAKVRRSLHARAD